MVRLASSEYEWARAQAFYRRTSISALISTLVAQAREQHEHALSQERRLAEQRVEALDNGFDRDLPL